MSGRVSIFNRKELTVTNDLRRQAEIREVLSSNDIDYDLKVINIGSSSFMGPSRGRGILGIDQDKQYEYRFYVHRDDYDLANHLINR